MMNDDQSGIRNLIVVHGKDGTIRKGYAHDFNPVRETFHLMSNSHGEGETIREVKIEDLIAVFFVKTFEGDRFYSEKKSFDEVDVTRLKGLKIKVTFRNGEVMRGVTLGYNKKKKGFFIIPVDPQSNNDRIYVVADAVESVVLGDVAEQ
jgi:hypothetical protein